MGCDLPAGTLPAGCGENGKITYQLESSQLGHTQLVRNLASWQDASQLVGQ